MSRDKNFWSLYFLVLVTSLPLGMTRTAIGAELPAAPSRPDQHATASTDRHASDPGDEAVDGQPAQDEDSDNDEQKVQDTGRSFVYKEIVFSGFYSPSGVVGLPSTDTTADHFEFSPRPPGNYLGAEYVRTFTESSRINKKLLPDWFSLSAINLHPRFVYDVVGVEDGLHRLKFGPQDFWVRFNLGGVDRLTLQVGQFVIPYGANPVMAPRQQFILPIESTDLGLKWDWGAKLKGPLRDYDWEIAATIGSGEGLHSPHFFSRGSRSSFLFTGRIGAPTYWDFQYGLSFLYGELPSIRGTELVSDTPIHRWRIAADTVYKHGTYLLTGAQLSFGKDGFDDRAGETTPAREGTAADVLGYRAWLDWIVPRYQDLRLSGQFESVIRDLGVSGSSDSAAILELGYSISTPMTVVFDYRFELSRARGTKSDAAYFTIIYYGR